MARVASVLSEGKAAGIVTAQGSFQLALEERSMVATKSRLPEGRTDFEIQVEGRVYPVALRGGQRGPARIAERGGMLPLTDGAASTRRSKKQAKPAVREKTVAEEILSRVWEPLPLAEQVGRRLCGRRRDRAVLRQVPRAA